MTPSTPVPNPGSFEAKSQGCTCPTDENREGKGVAHTHEGGGSGNAQYFCIAKGCPLHGF